MVSFICDACGNSVRKNQVEKHYQNQCRNCSVLSCIDCGVDFPGDSYINHTSCITEAEKYQGHLYQAKDKENKGEAKQKEWLKHVHGTSGGIQDPKLRNLLDKLSAYSNIPRKRKKFENFCKNSVNVYDTKTLDQLWDLFNTKTEEPTKAIDLDNTVEEPKENGSEKGESSSEETNGEQIETSIENNELDSEAPKKKKKKREKKSTLEELEAGADTKDIVNTETSLPIEKSNEIEEDQKVKKKKKNKKNKFKGEEDNNSENGMVNGKSEISDVTPNDNENKKKKRGRKHKLNVMVETEEINSKKKKKKKENNDDNDNTEEENKEEDTSLQKFHWHKVIKTVLKQSDDNEISIKKLRKKVLAAYQEHGIDHRASTIDESLALFDKKLKTYPKVKISKDIVKLVK